MGVPQIIMIVIITISLTVSLMGHGEEVKLNFFSSLIVGSIIVTLLIFGGFF